MIDTEFLGEGLQLVDDILLEYFQVHGVDGDALVYYVLGIALWLVSNHLSANIQSFLIVGRFTSDT